MYDCDGFSPLQFNIAIGLTFALLLVAPVFSGAILFCCHGSRRRPTCQTSSPELAGADFLSTHSETTP